MAASPTPSGKPYCKHDWTGYTPNATSQRVVPSVHSVRQKSGNRNRVLKLLDGAVRTASNCCPSGHLIDAWGVQYLPHLMFIPGRTTFLEKVTRLEPLNVGIRKQSLSNWLCANMKQFKNCVLKISKTDLLQSNAGVRSQVQVGRTSSYE